MSHLRRLRTFASGVVAFLALGFVALPLAGTAFAANPTVALANVDTTGANGGSDFATSKTDANAFEHLTATAASGGGGHTLTQVQFFSRCPTGVGAFNLISSDFTAPYEAQWDTSGITNGTVCDVRATAFENTGENASETEVITVDNRRAGVEISSPANGGTFFFFTDPGGTDHATVRGTASSTGGAAGTTALTGVTAYFANEADGVEPNWTRCGEDTTDDDAATAGFQFTIDCANPGVSGATIVKALADTGALAPADTDFEGGDAHEVTAQAMQTQFINVAISPSSDTGTAAVTCNEYTLTVTSSESNLPVGGVNVDVHADGPDDALSFARTGTTSTFRSPAGGHDTNDDSARCDQVAPNNQFNAGDTAQSQGTGIANTNFDEGRHIVTGAPDINHIESETDNNGQFVFAILSDTTGTTNITGWADVTAEDDVRVGSEPQATASKTWQAQVISLNAEPESQSNNLGQNHTITVTVTDQNNEPVAGVTPQMHVHSGPNNNITDACGAPTGANGQCTITYPPPGVNNVAGTDTMTVWLNLPSGATGHHDAGEPQDDVTKTWVQIAAGACLDAEPEDDLDVTTEEHTITATLTDSGGATANDDTCGGNPIANVSVDVSIEDDTPNAFIASVNGVATTGEPNAATGQTNASGQVTVTVKLTAAGQADTPANLAEGNEVLFAVTGSGATDAALDPTTGDDDQADRVQKRWGQAGAAAVLDLEPETDTNQVGTTHTITATVTDVFGNLVTANTNVDVFVEAGPNAGTFRECNTLTTGSCSVSYTGSGGAGDDTVRGHIDPNDDDVQPGEADATEGVDESTVPGGTAEPDNTDAVLKRWTLLPPTVADVEIDMEGCNGTLANFGAATWDATAAANPVDTTHEVCASAKDAAGNVLTGTPIAFTSSGPGHFASSLAANHTDLGTSTTVNIGVDGYAHAFLHSQESGNQVITATADSQSDTGTKPWTALEDRNIDVEPEDAENPPGTIHTVSATVTDRLGNGVAGVPVTFTESGPGRFTTGASQVVVNTDANGRAEADVTTLESESGTQTITGTIDPATGDCDLAANNPPGAPAGNCTDTVEKTWVEPTPPPAPECPGFEGDPRNHVVGTDGDDSLTGTAGDDIICAGAGDDSANGLGGNDLILGQGGNDDLNGGGGNDEIRGGGGNDTINGGFGSDELRGGFGADDLNGGGGSDDIRGGSGADTISGGPGSDTVEGNGGDDDISGGAGNDSLFGNGGDDVISGGLGIDHCEGGFGHDTLTGCETGSARTAAFRRQQL